jgi:hypothetical protein
LCQWGHGTNGWKDSSRGLCGGAVYICGGKDRQGRAFEISCESSEGPCESWSPDLMGKCLCATDGELNQEKVLHPPQVVSLLDVEKICALSPCLTNEDCPRKEAYPQCDLASGQCLPCLKNSDCEENPQAQGPRCLRLPYQSGTASPTTISWCGCANDRHCGHNPRGKRCTTGTSSEAMGVCYCTSDKDCPMGKKCTKLQPLLFKAPIPQNFGSDSSVVYSPPPTSVVRVCE